MTPKERAAMQQALEALESMTTSDWSEAFFNCEYDSDEPEQNEQRTLVKSAITALREALAELERTPITEPVVPWLSHKVAEQAEQEPVAWVTAKESFCGFPKLVFSETQKDGYKPLYAALVRTKNLTDDEIHEALHGKDTPPGLMNGIRAVIAADREKNRV